MVSPARLLAVVLLLAWLAPLVRGQQSGLLADLPGVVPSKLQTPPPSRDAALSERPQPWQVDLLLGLPGGVRVQRAVGDSPWLIEGFAGLELILPTVGLGIRRRFTVLEGTCNALLINPGIDAYLVVLPESHGGGLAPGGGSLTLGAGLAVIADIDLVWRRAIGDGVESQFGLKLGAGPVASHRARGVVVPVVGLFLGWGF
jgi:hypothetical protein